MGNAPRARAGRQTAAQRRAAETAAAAAEEQQPQPGQRSVDLNRVIHRMKLRAGEAEQEAAVLETLLEAAEAERDQLRAAVTQLQAELVAATSGRASSAG